MLAAAAGMLGIADSAAAQGSAPATKSCWDHSVIPEHLPCPPPTWDPFFLFFEQGSAELGANLPVLSNIERAYRTTHQTAIFIEGYTDASENPALSRLRAERVGAYLESLGIPPQAMKIQSFGAERMMRDSPDVYQRRVAVYFPWPYQRSSAIAKRRADA